MSEQNAPHQNDEARFEQQLDLLVDGQLDEADRRELLESLERRPDGWRRCALAFLETQCWQEALAAERTEMPAQPQTPPTGAVVPSGVRRQPQGAVGAWTRSRRGPQWLRSWVGTLGAMAATFLAALALGLSVRTWWSDVGRPDETSTPAVPAAPGALAGGGSAAEAPGRMEPAGSSATASDSGQGGLRWVTLYIPGGADGEEVAVQVPAVEREELDATVWAEPSLTPPPEVLETLRRHGVQWRRRRQLLPLPMPDGHQLVLPVEEVELHYVGSPAL